MPTVDVKPVNLVVKARDPRSGAAVMVVCPTSRMALGAVQILQQEQFQSIRIAAARPFLRATCLSSLNLRRADVAALLQKSHPLHQLRPVVLYVADLGPDFPRLDRAGVRLHQRRMSSSVMSHS